MRIDDAGFERMYFQGATDEGFLEDLGWVFQKEDGRTLFDAVVRSPEGTFHFDGVVDFTRTNFPPVLNSNRGIAVDLIDGEWQDIEGVGA